MSPLALNQNNFTMFRRWSTHGRYSLKSILPLLDELSGLLEIAYLIALAVPHSARQRMSGCSCLFDEATHVSQAVVYRSFCSGVLICDSLGVLRVRDHTLVCLQCFAFTHRGSLARSFHFRARGIVGRPSVADFPEGSIQFCTRRSRFRMLRCARPRS